MNHQTFDSFVRGAASSRDRRSALGLLGGAVLAATLGPRDASATLGGGKPKNECDDKKDKQKAKKKVKECQARADAACLLIADFFSAAACSLEMETCCALYGACQKKEAKKCVDQVLANYGHVQ